MRPLAVIAAGLVALGCGGEALVVDTTAPAVQYGGGGKSDDGWAVPDQANRAPDWLLAPAGHGTWDDTEAGSEYRLERAWIDLNVKNRRFHKRVLVEVAAPYATGTIRTLLPAAFERTLSDGWERWGTDSVEIYPDGGPHDAALSGPVLYRLRLQADPDDDGADQMVVTGWIPLFGEGEPLPVAHDPWLPGLRSPAQPPGWDPTPLPVVWFAPFDDPGARVVAGIQAITARQVAAPIGERHTLHAAIFNINDPRITDALIDAHTAGVEVRLVTEGTKLRPWQTWQTEYDRLLAADVPLLAVRRPGRAAMHDKLALFDGGVVATGSFNWEVGSSDENHENMLLLSDAGAVAAYARRFEVLAGGVQRPREYAFDPEGAVSVSFAPDEAPHVIAGQLIDSAQHRIRVAMFTAKDIEYEEAGQTTSLFLKLGAAVDRGVEVMLMTDYGIAEASEYFGIISEDDPQDEWLASLGVHVVLADNVFGQYASMHHKFMVVDDAAVAVGAMNWYYDAAYLNDEDQVLIRDAALSAEYTGELADLVRRYDSGWDPADWPAVALTVEVEYVETSPGDALALVGDLPELGAWDTGAALALSGDDWPMWRGTVVLPAGVRARTKLIVRRADGTIGWQPGADGLLRVPTGADEAVLSLVW